MLLCFVKNWKKRVAKKHMFLFSECQEEENRLTRCWSIHGFPWWMTKMTFKWANRSKCYLILANFCHGCSNIRANIRYISNIHPKFLFQVTGASLCFASLPDSIHSRWPCCGMGGERPAAGWFTSAGGKWPVWRFWKLEKSSISINFSDFLWIVQ